MNAYLDDEVHAGDVRTLAAAAKRSAERAAVVGEGATGEEDFVSPTDGHTPSSTAVTAADVRQQILFLKAQIVSHELSAAREEGKQVEREEASAAAASEAPAQIVGGVGVEVSEGRAGLSAARDGSEREEEEEEGRNDGGRRNGGD
jgi:hypothetical protein